MEVYKFCLKKGFQHSLKPNIQSGSEEFCAYREAAFFPLSQDIYNLLDVDNMSVFASH